MIPGFVYLIFASRTVGQSSEEASRSPSSRSWYCAISSVVFRRKVLDRAACERSNAAVCLQLLWADVGPEDAAVIRQHLLEQGGQEAPSVGHHESWRIRLQGATVTMFRSGTMYFTASAAAGPLVADALAFIDEVAPPRFVPTERTL